MPTEISRTTMTTTSNTRDRTVSMQQQHSFFLSAFLPSSLCLFVPRLPCSVHCRCSVLPIPAIAVVVSLAFHASSRAGWPSCRLGSACCSDHSSPIVVSLLFCSLLSVCWSSSSFLVLFYPGAPSPLARSAVSRLPSHGPLVWPVYRWTAICSAGCVVLRRCSIYCLLEARDRLLLSAVGSEGDSLVPSPSPLISPLCHCPFLPSLSSLLPSLPFLLSLPSLFPSFPPSFPPSLCSSVLSCWCGQSLSCVRAEVLPSAGRLSCGGWCRGVAAGE